MRNCASKDFINSGIFGKYNESLFLQTKINIFKNNNLDIFELKLDGRVISTKEIRNEKLRF